MLGHTRFGIGGIPELIDEGKTGMLFMPGNAEELKTQIAQMFATPFEYRQIALDAAAGKIDPGAIDDDMVASHLYTAGLPDPELVIRTSGELRLSNYLLWQVAYSEFYVTDTYWPDFDRWGLVDAILAYQGRDRRFGGLSKTEEA